MATSTYAQPRVARDVAAAPLAALFDRAAFAALWLFIFTIPWEEQVALPGGFAASRLPAAAAFLLALLRLALTGRFRLPSGLHYGLAALVAWSTASLLWTIDASSTVTRVGTYVQLLAMVWLIWELAPRRRRALHLLAAYVAGTCVSSISTIRNFMQGVTAAQARAAQGLTSWNEARYTAGFNENDLGLLLALSIPMSLYLLVRRQRRSVALLCWAQIAVAVTAILLTGSRGGLVSLLVALTMLPLALSGMSGLERGLSIAAVIAALAGGIYILPAETWERLMSIRTALFEGTLTHRTSIWAAGVEVFRQHPFLGVGAGAFGPSVLSLLDIPYVAHNSFLSVAVELGVIGAVIGVVLLASFYGAALRLPGLERRLWIVLLLTWTVGVSSLTWEYRKPTWFLFGLLAAQAAISRPRRAAPRAAVSRPFAEAYS